jgi:mxaK protein
MENRLKRKNWLLGLLLTVGIAGTSYEAWQTARIEAVNAALKAGKPVGDDAFPFQKKFAAAYDQGRHQDYKHAVQTYGQLLEMGPDSKQRARIQFNIANNLFLSGLERRVNDDGTLKDEARYAFTQARMGYEQALRTDPDLRAAKFNLTLLHGVMPAGTKGASREQAGMELSNLPIGLP